MLGSSVQTHEPVGYFSFKSFTYPVVLCACKNNVLSTVSVVKESLSQPFKNELGDILLILSNYFG